MLIAYFTNQALKSYPENAARWLDENDHPARNAGDTILLFSNRNFDRQEASRLYRERQDEIRLVEASGFDAIMINEHHTGPHCMTIRCNIMTTAIASITEKILLLQAGNPLPLWDNPVQCAEEVAMIDLMSGGRVIAGMVRGGGAEQLANNMNPAYNRERFEEAHDLIVKAWTVPGPWRWEGEHYQVRVVNPWVLPLQTPHPPIVVPGVTSRENIVFAARHGYPYIGLSTSLPDTKKMWELYVSVAHEVGYTAGAEHWGYLMPCHVQRDGDKARQNAANFSWMTNAKIGVSRSNPIWDSPTGYSSYEARAARLKMTSRSRVPEDQFGSLPMAVGTPKEVVEKLRIWLEETRPGMLIFLSNEGRTSHDDAVECIELFGQEVLPAVREIAAELDLPGLLEKPAGISPQAFSLASTGLRDRVAVS
jgi:alkanesulfonate monooxygenase SsuD/methylene tetrahydromethanopterin reductase-like flavin-dependent oxidoreductase (luciferase family)